MMRSTEFCPKAMTARAGIIALACIGGGALPAAAQMSFALPAGCEAYVTVQKRACTVSHLFRCDGDPEGHQRRVDLNESGLTYMGVIDAETQWIESFQGSSGETTTLAANPTDPASFTDLLASGRDGMDFQTQSDMYGLTRYVGEDRLTGVMVDIDGVTLQQTAFDMVVTDQAGEEVWRITGNEYIHPKWRTFLSGVRTFTTPDDAVTEDGTPMEFIFPGEDGFLSSLPHYECDVVTSQNTADLAVLPVSLKRN